MTSKARRLAAIAFSTFAVLLSSITIVQPYNNSPPIRSDGIGYHAWTQAIQRGSISFCKDKPILDTVGAVSMLHRTENRCGNKYPRASASPKHHSPFFLADTTSIKASANYHTGLS